MDDAKERRALALIKAAMATAERPVVLCSFGKDSLVLLHLCLRIRKIPVIFLRFPKFHEKHAHALKVMQLWDLEVYDMWPRTSTEYQSGTFFEVLHGYHTGYDPDGRLGTLWLFSGIRERHDGESRYLCAQDDLLLRPKSLGHEYPWDCTFHGHKGTDDPEIGEAGAIVQPISQVGSTRLVVPFIDWSDQDIWDYIKQYDLPYDTARYDEKNEAVSPDRYPTCFNCLDSHKRGEMVPCPKYNRLIRNTAQPPEAHEDFRQALVESVQYCEIVGAPRETPNLVHL